MGNTFPRPITTLGAPCHSVTGSVLRIELTSQKVLRFKENMKSLYLMEQKKAGAGSMQCLMNCFERYLNRINKIQLKTVA